MQRRQNLLDRVEVEILDENHRKVGEANSLDKAARMCYIKNSSSVWSYLFRGNKLRDKRALTSPVTGKKFRFKIKELI